MGFETVILSTLIVVAVASILIGCTAVCVVVYLILKPVESAEAGER